LARGWITVLGPRVMRCVPVKEAFSAITRVDATEVGGLGAEGIVGARLEDDIAVVASCYIKLCTIQKGENIYLIYGRSMNECVLSLKT